MSALLDALSYIGDSLDKPGRAVRGTLAGRPDEALAAIPFSDSMGWTDPSRAVSGRELLAQQGWQTGNDTLDAGLGFAADMALDPTTYLGIGGVGRLAKAAGAVDDAGRVGLKGLRDRFGMVIDTGDDLSLPPRVVGKPVSPDDLDAAVALSRSDPNTFGAYNSARNTGLVGTHATNPWGTRRHEVLHGLIDQSRKAGDPSVIPGAVGRLAARLPGFGDESASPLLRSLGLLAEETATHMAGAGRHPLRQLEGALTFWGHPGKVPFYGRLLEKVSPDVASVYRSARYIPGAAGIGAATGYGLSEIV